jgi:N-acyl-D-aspartate/D-glutamate deacylase
VADPGTRARLESEMTENLRRRGGPGALLITEQARTDIAGKTLAEIAKARGATPIHAAIDIILTGDASVASFNMQEQDIVTFMRQDFVMTGSDGSDGHPRKYGTYPRKFRDYVFGTRHPSPGPLDSSTGTRPGGGSVLSFEAAVHQSSALPAQALGIAQRGLLRQGYFADVVVIDTAQYAEVATYQIPDRLATGVRYAWVNGVLAVDGGRVTDALAGRALRRSAATPRR